MIDEKMGQACNVKSPIEVMGIFVFEAYKVSRFLQSSYHAGELKKVEPIMDSALDHLGKKEIFMRERFLITRSIARIMKFPQARTAMEYLGQLELQLPLITDNFNTNSHFCISAAHFMDSLVLAYANIIGERSHVGPPPSG